jgi:hypothetical protein
MGNLYAFGQAPMERSQRKRVFVTAFSLILPAPEGFEPRYADPEFFPRL